MGVFLGQLPPAELARLKAELAETLIAHFCYPRFFDYRTDTLRTRPVDRSKRQEVWLYLSSVDFMAWNRVDLMSPDFQHQVERLFIHFVQRNRNFFGEQGRKRMSDIRMLIGSSASSITEGLRGHLSGQSHNNPPFGSPRPVTSWSAINLNGRGEASWEQIAPATMLIQQQLQEVRGEIKSVPVQIEAPAPAPVQPHPTPTPSPARRSSRGHTTNGNATIQTTQTTQTTPQVEREAVPTSMPMPAAANGAAKAGTVSHPNGRGTTPLRESKSEPDVSPLSPAWNSIPSSPTAPMPRIEPVAAAASALAPPSTPTPLPLPGVEPPAPLASPVKSVAANAVPVNSPEAAITHPTVRERPPVQERSPVQEHPTVPLPPPPRVGVRPTSTMDGPASLSVSPRESVAVVSSDEDLAIFEQMRYQLIIWLRIEAIHSGIDVTAQATPTQLLDLLRQNKQADETRLQIVSSLLNLANQVIRNGHASLLDYKQALMFHLMHTKR